MILKKHCNVNDDVIQILNIRTDHFPLERMDVFQASPSGRCVSYMRNHIQRAKGVIRDEIGNGRAVARLRVMEASEATALVKANAPPI